MIAIQLLSAEVVRAVHALLQQCSIEDGKLSAGVTARAVKQNHQYQNSALLKQAQQLILQALQDNPVVRRLVKPVQWTPVLFNRYTQGDSYGWHTDNPYIQSVRSDFSYTVFLTDPERYEGGELVTRTLAGEEDLKLPAGEAVLYAADSVHCVRPITQGVRVAAVGWVQSKVADREIRQLCFELAEARLALEQQSSLSETCGEIALQMARVEGCLVRRFGA